MINPINPLEFIDIACLCPLCREDAENFLGAEEEAEDSFVYHALLAFNSMPRMVVHDMTISEECDHNDKILLLGDTRLWFAWKEYCKELKESKDDGFS